MPGNMILCLNKAHKSVLFRMSLGASPLRGAGCCGGPVANATRPKAGPSTPWRGSSFIRGRLVNRSRQKKYLSSDSQWRKYEQQTQYKAAAGIGAEPPQAAARRAALRRARPLRAGDVSPRRFKSKLPEAGCPTSLASN